MSVDHATGLGYLPNMLGSPLTAHFDPSKPFGGDSQRLCRFKSVVDGKSPKQVPHHPSRRVEAAQLICQTSAVIRTDHDVARSW